MNTKFLRLLFCGLLSLAMVACSKDDGSSGEWAVHPPYMNLSLDVPGTPVFDYLETIDFPIKTNSADLHVTKKPAGWQTSIVTLSNGYGIRITAPSNTSTHDTQGEIEITAYDIAGRVLKTSMDVTLDYEIAFADPAFEARLVSAYFNLLNANSKVSARSAYRYNSSLNVSSSNISNLSGIELFPNLTELDCSSNNLGALDLSGNPELKILYCSYNSISQLSLTNNEKLERLECSYNNLRELDFSNNKLLLSVNCSDNPALKKLNLRTNSALTELYCNDCALEELVTSGLAKLEELYCSNNSLSSLDMTYNLNLTDLYCNNNKLTYIDVHNSDQLDHFRCIGQTLEAGQTTTIKVWPNFDTATPPTNWSYDPGVVWEK